MADGLRFETECQSVQPGDLVLTHATGRHRLSAPYEYELTLSTSQPGGLPSETIDELLAMPCRVELGPDAIGAAEVHGVLDRVALAPMRTGNEAFYRATLRPRLSRLSLSYGSRIFQDKTWPEIVAAVLEEHAVVHELRLSQTYPTREYTVQYEESDLAFVSRLLEHFGIFYFFEQTPDGERVIVADDNRELVALEGHESIPYEANEQAADGAGLDTPAITQLGRAHEVRPGKVDLKDYNWRHPRVVPEAEAPADETSGAGTIHAYGEHIKDADEGAFLARVRAEELMSTREVYRGGCTIPGLSPGHRFALQGYPSGDLDQDYAVTETEHSFVREGGRTRYEKRFVAIPLGVPYRPPRETPKPRIVGFMHATVDGEVDGMAAPIDELGRYKLNLHFDRYTEPGGKASRWVRMAQASSGPSHGVHLPLHIGSEVALVHLGGDPDRPIILGAVPNTDTMSPVTQDEATKARIRTKAGILMEFEDSQS